MRFAIWDQNLKKWLTSCVSCFQSRENRLSLVKTWSDNYEVFVQNRWKSKVKTTCRQKKFALFMFREEKSGKNYEKNKRKIKKLWKTMWNENNLNKVFIISLLVGNKVE